MTNELMKPHLRTNSPQAAYRLSAKKNKNSITFKIECVRSAFFIYYQKRSINSRIFESQDCIRTETTDEI